MNPKLLGVIAMLAATSGSAAEYSLEFQTVSPTRASSIAGNTGAFASLSARKPTELVGEPAVVSAHALYGTLRPSPGRAAMVVRLDQSKGDGSGYDRLIIDLNGNRNLTDDPVISTSENGGQRLSGSSYSMEIFGPIAPPSGQAIAGWPMAYYAQAIVSRNAARSTSSSSSGTFIGQLRLQAGWYAVATVNIDGKPRKLGLLDADANFKLGDSSASPTYRTSRSSEESWSFPATDAWLCDIDHSGSFENRTSDSEDAAFGPIVYFDAVPYRVTLNLDRKAIVVEPWAEPTGLLALKSEGAPVRNVVLAWKAPGSSAWQRISAPVSNGIVRVPAGEYRIYEIELRSTAGESGAVAAFATFSGPGKPTEVAPNGSAALACGGPLRAKLSFSSMSGMLLLQAKLFGSAGETYSSFLGGTAFRSRPSAPKFELKTKDGVPIESGTMEYG